MRKLVWLGICTLALGLGVSVASADVITVALTGHVIDVYDSSLGVTVGQAVTATYSYDTSSLGSNGSFQPAPPYANIDLSVTGGPAYQTQSNWAFTITVSSGAAPEPIFFNYTATSPSSSSGGSTSLSVAFAAPAGLWLSPSTLPTTAPSNLTTSPTSPGVAGEIEVELPNSYGFAVQVDSAALAPAITVSPASSSFIAQQNFDAVLLLSAQISVTSMQASVGGTSIGFSYPGTCQLAAANAAQRTALICPNAAAVLAGLGGGPVTINWLVTLADGSTLQQSVIWNLVL